MATDGHRLALARSAVDADVEMAGIVPRKAVQELTRVLGGAERVDLAVGESKFFVRTEGFELVSKLVEGQFPNYEQVIPKSSPLKAGRGAGAPPGGDPAGRGRRRRPDAARAPDRDRGAGAALGPEPGARRGRGNLARGVPGRRSRRSASTRGTCSMRSVRWSARGR